MTFILTKVEDLSKDCSEVQPLAELGVMRRIIAKTVLSIVKLDVLEAAGSLQLCAGQDAGNEAAARAIYCDDSAKAVLLVDASNAFNCFNRQVALHNI